ncbi:MAG: chloride channel protein [Nocardioides sp.]
MSEQIESDDSFGDPEPPRRTRFSSFQMPTLDALAGFESTRYLGKWLIIGGLIGLVAGLGAVVFTHAIQIATEFFLGRLVGYTPPKPIGEGNYLIQETIARPWLLPLVTALGGLLSGIIVFRFAPSAEGHGTDAAIDAILHKDGHIDPKVPPVKLVASAITIGSGGSAGREGPAAQISAGFASMLSGWLKLSPNDRRIAASAGMGSGIGAIFRAPLGGALMSAEILYLHDLEVEALIPALIASIVGYSVYGTIEGWEPIFGQQSGIAFDDPTSLIYYALLGVVAGLVGILYAKCFYGTVHLFHKLHVPLWVKPAIGWLTGWRLTFGGEDLGWDGALSTIVEDPIEQVFVAVYDVSREDEANLDGWESTDTGLYRKMKVRVSTMNGELLAWTYVLDAFEGGLPSASYLGVVADAAEAADAPADYVVALRLRPCRSLGH